MRAEELAVSRGRSTRWATGAREQVPKRGTHAICESKCRGYYGTATGDRKRLLATPLVLTRTFASYEYPLARTTAAQGPAAQDPKRCKKVAEKRWPGGVYIHGLDWRRLWVLGFAVALRLGLLRRRRRRRVVHLRARCGLS